MAKITIDNRLRVECGPEARQALEREFTYPNPDRAAVKRLENAVKAQPKNRKLRGMLIAALKAQSTMQTYSVADGFSLARGSLSRARETLEAVEGEVEIVDRRSDGDPRLGPVRGRLVHEPWPFQARMLEAALAGEQGMVLGQTGCIVGTATIGLNRGGKGFTLPLSEVVKRFNGGKWDLEIPTYVRSHVDGHVRLSRLLGAQFSGEKPVFEVTVECGYSVEGTADHEFLTSEGWKRLDQLTVNDLLLVEEGRRPRASGKPWKPKAIYKVINGLRHHPFAGRRALRASGWSVPMHRLVVEAHRNRLTFADYISRLRVGAVDGLEFLDPDLWAVHHRDENPRNNAVVNLEVETHEEHKRRHALDGGWKNLAVRTVPSRVVSIVSTGVKPTYDLTLEEPHNFLANGIVVHNCGKTVVGFSIALAVRVPTLVLVWSSGLMKDWIRRAQEEAGICEEDIGVIGGGEERIRPLTIGMVQTITRHGRKWAGRFGCVLADEIERFAAQSLYDSVDLFQARYRIGIGAEYKRKDHKEFLTSDLFGDELIRVEREEIGDKILDVEHRLFETEFGPDWYLDLPQASRGFEFNRLLDSLYTNRERNQLLAQMAAREVREGYPVLAFAHRREHVRMLEADLRREVGGLPANATGVMLGGKADEAEFERCTAGFRAGTLRFAGTTYQAASVGINLPSLPVGLVASPCHNNPNRLNQTQGRLRRVAAGKTGARLYIPWDRKCFGLAPLRASLRAAKAVKVLVGDQWVDGREVLEAATDDEQLQERELERLREPFKPGDLDELFQAVR